MAKELEYKYLVKNSSFMEMAVKKYEISQGYLSRDKGRTVRIRTRNECAFLTIKGPNTGCGRDEFEYEIPINDALQMLQLCPAPVIVKTRYIVPFDSNNWEIDVFHGDLEGLVTAELEVPSVDYQFSLPSFIGRDVTNDRRFYNSCLTTFDDLKSAL